MAQLMSLNHTSSGPVAVASESQRDDNCVHRGIVKNKAPPSQSLGSLISLYFPLTWSPGNWFSVWSVSVPNKTMFQFRPSHCHQWCNSSNQPLVSRIHYLQKFRFTDCFLHLPNPPSIVSYHLVFLELMCLELHPSACAWGYLHHPYPLCDLQIFKI